MLNCRRNKRGTKQVYDHVNAMKVGDMHTAHTCPLQVHVLKELNKLKRVQHREVRNI